MSPKIEIKMYISSFIHFNCKLHEMICPHQVATRPHTSHIHFILSYKDIVLSSSHFLESLNLSIPKTNFALIASRSPTSDTPCTVEIHEISPFAFLAQTVFQGKSYSGSPTAHPGH